MENVAIVVIVVVGVASLGLAVVGTYRNVNNPQAQVIRTLLEEIERLNGENKSLRDHIIFLARGIPVHVNIDNQRSGGVNIDKSTVNSEHDIVGGDQTKRDEIKT